MIDNRLLSLIKITETGSFTKAAQALSLSQPAVSQHVKQLENDLGVKLFDYAHNKFNLTPEGEIVVTYARRMAALYSKMEEELRNERGVMRSFTVGITHTAESSAIIEALAAYANTIDGLNLKIFTYTTDKLYSMLKNYELDFAFVEGKTNDSELRYAMLDTDCLVLAVSPGHKLASQSLITVNQLKEEKLILRLPNSNTRSLFTASLESQNLNINDFNIVMEIDSIATIKDLIRRDFGVSVLAKSACVDEVKKGKLKLLAIENLSMMREINIVYQKDFEHPEIIDSIVKTYNDMNNR
ncbi:MAG: LysR family transcriptional regulator [Lachnospiraceae bacterium]|nr:LysR family transcriptional regulator [Lachnospiraceae bacterium]